MKTRFAPSPTGWMHFGNLRTALFNFLFAHKQQYKFLLRIEDTDLARSSLEFQEDLLIDLKWLSLKWDEGPLLQSERTAIYNKYYKQLEDQKLAYPCFCSEETLGITRKVQMAAGKPPRYPGTCRALSDEEVKRRFDNGEKATLRFMVPRDEIIQFVDLVKGPQKFAANDIGDFIIRRNDGSSSFMFCNAIDDAEMGVTHALRGDDHLTNTPRQLMILKALSLTAPEYGHFAMINGTDGAPLSKRNGSEAIRELRAQGYHPLAVANYLARLGHYYALNDFMTLPELAQNFDLKHISTSPARHDVSHLRHWQKEAIMRSTPAEIITLVSEHVSNFDAYITADKQIEFIDLIKDNILMPSDAKIWLAAVHDPVLDFSDAERATMHAAGQEFFKVAMQTVQQNPSIGFKELADAVKNVTGAKGKELFMPLRIALTGQSHGPELAKLMAFMQPDLVVKRFADAAHEVGGHDDFSGRRRGATA